MVSGPFVPFFSFGLPPERVSKSEYVLLGPPFYSILFYFSFLGGHTYMYIVHTHKRTPVTRGRFVGAGLRDPDDIYIESHSPNFNPSTRLQLSYSTLPLPVCIE